MGKLDIPEMGSVDAAAGHAAVDELFRYIASVILGRHRACLSMAYSRSPFLCNIPTN